MAVYDLHQHSNTWSIVMEYLAGPSVLEVLSRCFQNERFAPVYAALSVSEQVCRGLECAHAHGVIHRDISADNVMLTFDGQAKILDFGIAKETLGTMPEPDHAAHDGTTGGGTVVGKLQYMAPERLVGDPATAQSDIYAVGLLLVQLLGAPVPERGADLAGDPRPVSPYRDDLPPGLEALIGRAMAPHPKQRFTSAAAMAHELRVLLAELDPVDMSAWLRELCAAKWQLSCALDDLTAPVPTEVEDFFTKYHRVESLLETQRLPTSHGPSDAAGPEPTMRM